MVKSSLDALATDLDASFDIRPVATEMPTAGAHCCLELTAFAYRFACLCHPARRAILMANLRVPVAGVGQEIAQQLPQALARGVRGALAPGFGRPRPIRGPACDAA